MNVRRFAIQFGLALSIVCAATLAAPSASAQYAALCVENFSKSKSAGGKSAGFAAPEATEILQSVKQAVGIPGRKITLVPCNMQSKVEAFSAYKLATVPDGEYVVYNEDWVREVVGNDHIQGVVLFGHELGHFLNGDFAPGNGDEVTAAQEESADYFAGCAAARMDGQWLAVENLLFRLRKPNSDGLYPDRIRSIAQARLGFENCGGVFDVDVGKQVVGFETALIDEPIRPSYASRYGSLAVAISGYTWAIAVDASSEAEAKSAALNECRKSAKIPSECQEIIWVKDGCAGIGIDTQDDRMVGAWGISRAETQESILRDCPNCRIERIDCTSR